MVLITDMIHLLLICDIFYIFVISSAVLYVHSGDGFLAGIG